MRETAMHLTRVTRWSVRAACLAAVMLVSACNDASTPKPPEPGKPPQPKTSMVPSLVTSAMAADAPAAASVSASASAS